MRTIVLAALLPLAACGNSFDWNDDGEGIKANGTGTSRTFDVNGFTQVHLAGSDDVEVRVGPDFAVRAEGDPQALDRLKITRDDDGLHVSRRSGTSSGRVRVFVSMPSIKGAHLGGSGNMMIDRVQAEEFEANIAGSGNMAIGQLQARETDFSIAGSGDLSAAGSAGRLDVNIAGSGNIDAPRLTASAADIKVAGSGDVRTVVRGRAEVKSLGSGDIDLGAEARCSVTKLGSGEVRCGG